MAANQVRMALGALVLGAVILAIPAARGQEEPASPARAREALSEGMKLFKSHDYEKAAPFFAFAQAGQQHLSPSQKQDLADFGAQNAAALKGREEGAVQLQQAELAVKQGRTQEAKQILNTLNANQYLTQAERQQVTELGKKVQAPTTTAAPAGKDAKSLLAAGRDALKAGDLTGAESFADQADKATGATWLPSFTDTPAKLRRDILAAKVKSQPEPKTPAATDKGAWWQMDRLFGKGEKTPTPPEPKIPEPAPKNTEVTSTSKFGGFWPFGGNPAAPPKKDSSDERANAKAARHALNDAYIMLEAGDYDKARFIANMVKQQNVAWAADERNPDALLLEVAKRTGGAMPSVPVEAPKNNPVAQATPKTPAPAPAIDIDPKADPRTLLKQGRTLLAQRKLDEADKACASALTAKVSWGFWEDTPEKLRKDLVRARQLSDRDESVRLMVEARKALASGNYEDAEKKAYRAQQLHGPYGALDFGDRPAKLLEEVTRARKDNPSLAKKETPAKDDKVAIAPGIPSGVQNANKNRAIVVIREARELERQGMLAEARQKAFEARTLKASFQPDEDSPENVLITLSAKADRQIRTHMQQSLAAAGVVSDAQRFEKAIQQLVAARQLAMIFEFDLSQIDQAAQQLQQVQAGSRPITAVAHVPMTADPFRVTPASHLAPTGDPKKDAEHKVGFEKLQFAQRELTAGNLPTATRMAEDLCNPKYGVQEDAQRLLRSIAAEEYNQQILRAKRTFESGLDCVVKKDYRKAMFVFQEIDPMYLPPDYQGRLKDVMAMREMQPQAEEQKYQNPNLLKGAPIDEKNPATARAANDDGLFDNVKAMEKVQFEALRQRGYEALKIAHEKFKSGQKDEAIKTLDGFVAQVNLADLSDKSRVNDLRRPAETRIQQYKTLMAESALVKASAGERFPMKYEEGTRQVKQMEKQKELVTKMKEANELLKQNKLKEAAQIARQVLEVDPENTAALMLVTIAQTRYNQEKHDKDTHDNENIFLAAGRGNLTTTGRLPDTMNPVDFDADYLQRRQKAGDGSILHQLKDPKERAIEYRLRQPISLNFNNTPLKDAINAIAIQSGVQVVPDTRALIENRVNLDSPLSGSADNINMKNALNILLSPMKLTYIIEDQVLKITTEDRTKGRLVRITYPIADLVVPVEDHPLPDVYDITKVLTKAQVQPGMSNYLMQSPFGMNGGQPISSHGLGNQFGSQHGQGGGPGEGPRSQTKDQVAELLKNLIQNTIAKNTWEDMGGTGSIQYFPMGLALVINQPQEVQEEVQLLLQTLRKLQDLQVSVELRAVLVSETFFERIGVDFDMNIQTPISRTEPNLINGTFVPAPFVNRVGRGLNMISGLTSAGTLTPDLNIPIRNSTFNFTTPQFGGYQPEAGLSLGLAFLSDIQVFMFLEAVQGDRRAHIMQAPKLTVYNGQTATITGVMVRPSVTNMFANQLPNGALFMQPLITGVPFGLTMTVQPVVSPDRRFIRLNVRPQLVGQGVDDPAAAIVTAIPQALPGLVDGPGGFPALPVPPLPNSPFTVSIQPQPANVFIAQTTVNVPDGGTVLLGGFKFLAEERTEYGPPVLSKIPYISRLFRNVGWSRDGSTLIYLVTARVIMIEEEENIFLGNLQPIPGR